MKPAQGTNHKEAIRLIHNNYRKNGITAVLCIRNFLLLKDACERLLSFYFYSQSGSDVGMVR